MIGLCRGVAGLPQDLENLGYQDRWVEFDFKTLDGSVVHPELILASEKLGHTILCEWKSGANWENGQLDRYSKVTPKDLRDRAYLPVDMCSQHDVALFGQAEWAERLRESLARAGYDFPFINVSSCDMRLVKNSFCVQPTNQTFADGLTIELGKAPLSFVPFDRESPDWIIAQEIARQLASYMASSEAVLILGKILEDLFPVWNCFASHAKKELKNRVRDIILQGARGELSVYLTRNKAMEGRIGSPTWEIKQNPARESPANRGRAWQSYLRSAEAFVGSLGAGAQGRLDLGLQDE